MDDKELTHGEKAVGLKFNPGGNIEVDTIKRAYATVIDLSNDACKEIYGKGPVSPEDGEKLRMHKIAITEAQTAQMWAVKAATWGL